MTLDNTMFRFQLEIIFGGFTKAPYAFHLAPCSLWPRLLFLFCTLVFFADSAWLRECRVKSIVCYWPNGVLHNTNIVKINIETPNDARCMPTLAAAPSMKLRWREYEVTTQNRVLSTTHTFLLST